MVITLVWVETNHKKGPHWENLHYIYRAADELCPEDLALDTSKTG